jgi:hypothetical protein
MRNLPWSALGHDSEEYDAAVLDGAAFCSNMQ